MSLTAIQSALSQPNGALQNFVSTGNPTAVAAFILSVSQTLNLGSSSANSAYNDSTYNESNSTKSPIAQQQEIGTAIGIDINKLE